MVLVACACVRVCVTLIDVLSLCVQAVMASDFALPRFQYLQKLLLVHGHWCYSRLANMILYFFYKNAVRSCGSFKNPQNPGSCFVWNNIPKNVQIRYRIACSDKHVLKQSHDFTVQNLLETFRHMLSY